MLYTEMTKKAILLAFRAHEGQTDKAGMPYILHPLHLAEQMEDEASAAAALLHDVAEDTEYTIDDIRGMGFPDEVISALELLTHDKSVPYMDYAARIGQNPIARRVKIADLRHNCDLSRIGNVTPRDLERVEKYKAALRLLTEAEER